jgi:hypothetical protein
MAHQRTGIWSKAIASVGSGIEGQDTRQHEQDPQDPRHMFRAHTQPPFLVWCDVPMTVTGQDGYQIS